MRAFVQCRCGAVRGAVEPAAPRLATRMICYCDDCQAYAHHLRRPDLLDAKAGTALVIVPAAALSFAQGQDRIGAVRLSPKGPYRWHARCCGSPLGNTVTPALPFVSMPVSAFRAQDVEAAFGARSGAIMGQFALGGPPPGSVGFGARLKLAIVAKVLAWKLSGRTWPHPFFSRETGKPLYPVHELARAERDRLRPLCGPAPSQPASFA